MNTDQLLLGELLTESSIDAMIAIGTDNEIISWNKAASLLFNVRKNDALGSSLAKTLPSINEDAAFLNAIKYAKEGKQSYLPATNDHTHRQHVETHIVPLKNGKPVAGILLLIHDVSHRIAKEEQLQHLNTELL